MIHVNNFYYEWVRFIDSFAMLEKPALGHTCYFHCLKLTLSVLRRTITHFCLRQNKVSTRTMKEKKYHCGAISYAKLILDISIYSIVMQLHTL